MKHLRKFNESIDNIKETVEDLLRDFSDDEDIPVVIEIRKLRKEIEINIGKIFKPKIIDIQNNIDCLISMNDYLESEGYKLYDVESSVRNYQTKIITKKICGEFDEFISFIENMNYKEKITLSSFLYKEKTGKFKQ
jgi:hypothetical protein